MERPYVVSAPVMLCALVVAACGDSEPAGPTLTGGIDISASTTGVDIDEDGYEVHLDYRIRQLEPNGQLQIRRLADGDYTLTLLGIDDNCQVAGDNPRMVNVSGGEIVPVTLSVSCVSASGQIRVSVGTVGEDPDGDGYTVVFEGPATPAKAWRRTDADVTTDGTTSARLRAGEYSVRLDGVAPHCDVADSVARAATILVEQTIDVHFDVACGTVMQLAFVEDGEIHILDSNRNGLRQLTQGPGSGLDPSWSPDGSTIAFVRGSESNADIYLMDADGANVRRLTNGAAARDPAWSPDGRRIAFAGASGGDFDVFVMNADGSNVVRLTDDAAHDAEPAWSPDGSAIAFSRARDDDRDLWIIPADGSAPGRRVGTGGHPTWSPDGSRLAVERVTCENFYTCGLPSIVVMNADGTGARDVATGTEPAWSPDGRVIAYRGRTCVDWYCYYGFVDAGIFIFRLDGTEPTELWRPPAGRPAWRP